MIFISNDNDPQVLGVLKHFQKFCPEKILKSDSLVLQTTPGNFIREKDGSLPTRLTAIAHGKKTTFGGKTAEILAREYIAQLGPPHSSPIRTIDLVGCEIGIVKYSEAGTPLLETKNTKSENYCFAQDFSERLKAAGYNIQVNVFSNPAHKGPIQGMEFTKISKLDQFCLVGYKTKTDIEKSEQRDEIYTKMDELTQQLKFVVTAFDGLTTVVCRNPDDHKAIQAELKKLESSFSHFGSTREAFAALSDLKEEIKSELMLLDKQQKKLASEINYILLLEIDNNLRSTLDRTPHCRFPMPKIAAPISDFKEERKIGFFERKTVSPSSSSSIQPTPPKMSK